MSVTSTTAIKRGFWREYRSTLLFLVLMLAFRSAWADWVSVPTGSMNPTILEGDRILVNKHAYGVRIPWTLVRLTEGEDPQRGDIVVFDSPLDGTSLVKRLIGVPGDLVALDARGLIVNGARARYSTGEQERTRGLAAATVARQPAIFREAGPVPEHDILLLAQLRQGDTFGPVRVPQDMYLMLGDNRDNSADSRFFGFVPRRNIVGRASRVAISLDPENHFTPRRGRFLTPLE